MTDAETGPETMNAAKAESAQKKAVRRTGQIIKRGENRYLVRIYLGRDQNGKRHDHNHTVRGAKKDAQKWLNGALRRLDLGEPIEQSDILCSEFFERWLETAIKPRVRPRSFAEYEHKTRKYVLPALGKKRLSDVKPFDLQTLYADLQRQGLANTTIRYVHGLLNNAFKQAVRWEMVRQNPAQLVDPPRQEKREMSAMDSEQARAFLKAIEADRYYPVFVFLLSTGCRPGEAAGLKWSDFDPQAGTITISRSLYWQRNGKGWTLTEPKTKQSRRTIPLGASTIKTLKDWKRRQAEERLRAGRNWQGHDFIFTQEDGGPVYLDSLRKRFKDIIKKAGLPDFRLYDLRHSCASILMAEGANPRIVAEQLGHSNISQTLGTYSHVTPGLKSEAARKIENALFEGTGTL